MTGWPGIRLLLADVDGTLVTNDKVLTPEARAACRALHAAGIALALVSSRPPRGLHPLIAPLDLRGPIAGFNGGMLVHTDLSVIESHPIDPGTARTTVTFLVEQGLDVWVYTETEWLVRNRTAAHVAREETTLQIEPRTVAAFSDIDLARAVKITGVSDDFDRVAACEKSAPAILGKTANAVRSQRYFLDVTHPCANKGAVAARLCDRMNLLPAQIATIGDMPTDVAMFRKSGFSIAMGNAGDEVKAQASAVTDTNENDGFAKAVRKFIL
jgi:Cof subfamily protein (haloacid dehalogenase superfamily)